MSVISIISDEFTMETIMRFAVSSRSPPPPVRQHGSSRVVEMDLAVGGEPLPMAEQASRDVQALAVHDRVRGVDVP